MLKPMTDWDATHGAYRARTCEWIENIETSDECGAPTLKGKAYCSEHHERSYRKVKKEVADKLTEEETKSYEDEPYTEDEDAEREDVSPHITIVNQDEAEDI